MNLMPGMGRRWYYSHEREGIKMRVFMLVVAILSTVGFVVIGGVGDWMVQRDTDKVLERAQIAADREDMLQYMTELRDNMQARGMTHGNTALVFKTKMNDMGLHYKAVNNIIDRLKSIHALKKDDTAYQVALDDLRGTIRELPNFGGDWYYINTGVWLLIIGGAIWLLTGVAWLIYAIRGDF